jgi:hypothetical protein
MRAKDANDFIVWLKTFKSKKYLLLKN